MVDAELLKDILDIINRLQAEIERLKGWQDLLKAEKHSLIKAEAIKEFAERLKEHIEDLEYKANTPRKTVSVQTLYDQINWVLNEVIPNTIDGALKEMVGEDK